MLNLLALTCLHTAAILRRCGILHGTSRNTHTHASPNPPLDVESAGDRTKLKRTFAGVCRASSQQIPPPQLCSAYTAPRCRRCTPSHQPATEQRGRRKDREVRSSRLYPQWIRLACIISVLLIAGKARQTGSKSHHLWIKSSGRPEFVCAAGVCCL